MPGFAGLPSLYHRSNASKSAHNQLARILFEEKDWIQLANLPQRIQEWPRGSRSSLILNVSFSRIEFCKRYFLDSHVGKA